MTDTPLFELRDVSFAYPGGPAVLDDVSLEIGAGESVALLGANACGKSTLLHLLDGLYFPTAGTVRAFGRPLAEETLHGEYLTTFRQRVGLLFQHSDAQLFCATVEEELAFAPLQLGMAAGDVRERVEDTLRLLEIEGLRARPPHTLSGGEKKRVALGCLLTASPQVLLLDEPASGLDPRSQQWLLEFVLRLRESGLTLVVASHDLEMALEMADRAVVLSEDHQVVADGVASEVVADLDLLLRVNLIHAHAHAHGSIRHVHPHLHGLWHDHAHGREEG